MSNNRSRNRGPRPEQVGDSHAKRAMPFRFKHNEKTYFIPPATEATERLDAGAFIDAVKGDEMGQMKYFVSLLEAAGPEPEAMAALRSMPLKRFANVMREWVERTGGHPGKSRPSSD